MKRLLLAAALLGLGANLTALAQGYPSGHRRDSSGMLLTLIAGWLLFL